MYFNQIYFSNAMLPNEFDDSQLSFAESPGLLDEYKK